MSKEKIKDIEKSLKNLQLLIISVGVLVIGLIYLVFSITIPLLELVNI